MQPGSSPPKCSFCEFPPLAPICSINLKPCSKCFAKKRPQYMSFPCTNLIHGCRMYLHWDERKKHEKVCPYNRHTCPFLHSARYRCQWKGAGPSISDHLYQEHGTNFVRKIPEINFSSFQTDQIYFSRIFQEIMVLYIKYQPPDKYWCTVMVNGYYAYCDKYSYQAELYTATGKTCLILRRPNLEDFSSPDSYTNPDNMLLVDVSMTGATLDNPQTIMGRFTVLTNRDNKQITWLQTIDGNLLRDLECPVCTNYMTPPIFLCVAGHSVCRRCREQVDYCPTCREPFEDARNYALEQLTSAVNFPCMHRDNGCYVTCSSEELHEHELSCGLGKAWTVILDKMKMINLKQ